MSKIPAFVHAQGSWGEIGHQVGTMLSPAIARHVEAWAQHISAETCASRERVFEIFIDDPSGWGDGLPRYLLSRLALREDSAERAVKAMLDIPRAASRNVLVADDRGVLLDAELLCKEAAVISGTDDLLVHA